MGIDEESLCVAEDVISVESEHVVTSAREWLEVRDVMNRDVMSVGPGETVIVAAEKMADANISSVIIVDDGDVAGILTETDLVRRVCREDYDVSDTCVSEVMSSPVISIGPGESVLRAGQVMESRHIKRLPVVSHDELVGIVTQTDLVRVLTSFGTRQAVSEIMSTNVFGIGRKETAAGAAAIMASESISSVVIFDGSEVVGVFSERDFLKRIVAARKDPAETKVEEVMSSSVMSVGPEYTVFNAKKIMESTDVQRLAVVEGGEVLGIVTQTDIFMAIKDKLQAEQEKHLMLLEESESSIFTIDPEGITTYVNSAFAELLEVASGEELVGRPFLPEQFWADPDEREKMVGELKGEKVKTVELALLTGTGRELHVTCFSTFTRNTHGEINGRQGTLHDITEGKIAEAELKHEMRRRQEVEEELRRHSRFWFRFNKSPRIVKEWYRTEEAYRRGVEACQKSESMECVAGHLREAVDGAVATVKLAGLKDTCFAEVEELYEYLDSAKVTTKGAVDGTRHLLNWLGRKAPFEANLWYIECRGSDE